MLVGALVSRCTALTPWVPGSATDVLLVDGPIVGTAGLVHSAETARAMGARRVDAVTVGSRSELASLANTGIDHLWIIRLAGAAVEIRAD